MSDPTIQTFCCHHSNTSNITMAIMKEFNTEAYNCVCLFSSTLGILGALYQILPRQQFSKSGRWYSFTAVRGRKIIIWLAVSDLFASLGVFIRSLIWIRNKNIMPAVDDHSSVIFCVISSAWVQYFYIASWIWTLCYAIDMKLVLSEKDSWFASYHIAAWLISAVLTTAGLGLLYLPDANCHVNTTLMDTLTRILPNYLATYIPMATVMIANPCLYLFSTRDMQKIITCSSGQYTNRERDLLDAVRVKFSTINCVFYLCWLPNLINGLLIWTLWFNLPVELLTNIWYMMAFTNPLQALFNSLVYRRWNSGSEKIIVPWKKQESSEVQNFNTPNSSTVDSFDENLPLLQSLRRSSINGYSTYK
ncbi:G-protein coupled receptor 143-like [Agrilus planipennis]|uniref:G-protein coupled receptor 143-like n=1 Tax=Agrilus planipennis TaxID=224129 RepID=A0A1W4XLQ4_AGRPL|nr:G-protein coupled receptor 143-like [Agrilus planipennis]